MFYDREYYEGPSYGIEDSQQVAPKGYCRECGGELYSYEQAELGLCDYCQRELRRNEEDEE